MDLSAPSWDLFIVLFLIVTVGYGFLMQRERLVVTIVAAYIGLLLTTLFWPNVHGFFQGDNPLLGRYFIRGNFSESQIQIGLFLIGTVLVASKAGIDAERGRGWLSPLEVMVLSALIAAFFLSTILHFLPEGNVTGLVEQSKLVSLLVKHYNLWLLAPLGALIFLGFRGGGSRRSE